MMRSAKNLATMIHREEIQATGKNLPTREGVLALMKVVCPTLKLTYPFVTRCIKCSVLENMLKRWYDPKYEGKVYPGDDSKERCNEGGWPVKNFAMSVALQNEDSLFGTKLCENVTATDGQQEEQVQQQQQ